MVADRGPYEVGPERRVLAASSRPEAACHPGPCRKRQAPPSRGDPRQRATEVLRVRKYPLLVGPRRAAPGCQRRTGVRVEDAIQDALHRQEARPSSVTPCCCCSSSSSSSCSHRPRPEPRPLAAQPTWLLTYDQLQRATTNRTRAASRVAVAPPAALSSAVPVPCRAGPAHASWRPRWSVSCRVVRVVPGRGAGRSRSLTAGGRMQQQAGKQASSQQAKHACM